MNLADLIEKKRFVGREFLVWLWFESEILEGRLSARGGQSCELFLESKITLVQEKEKSQLDGAVPAQSPEAHEALRQGKLPTKAKLRVTRGEFDYSFVYAADTMALSAVKLPAVVREETDEQFYERMYLLEQLEAQLDALYADFAALRISALWDTEVVPVIRAWVHGKDVDLAAYRRTRGRVAPLGGGTSTNEEPKLAKADQSTGDALRVA
jgi:hypothetical protein